MRIEGRVGYLRAAMIQAVLKRNYAINIMNNEDEQEPSYRLGRLLAVLERLQNAAVGTDTVSGFFGAASTTPALAIPRLIRGAQRVHLQTKFSFELNSPALCNLLGGAAAWVWGQVQRAECGLVI
jgi:CRISPR-associated protein Csd1